MPAVWLPVTTSHLLDVARRNANHQRVSVTLSCSRAGFTPEVGGIAIDSLASRRDCTVVGGYQALQIQLIDADGPQLTCRHGERVTIRELI